jgi:hypothetical protein
MSYLYSAKSNAFVAAGSVLLDTPEFSDAVEIDAAVFDEFFRTKKMANAELQALMASRYGRSSLYRPQRKSKKLQS